MNRDGRSYVLADVKSLVTAALASAAVLTGGTAAQAAAAGPAPAAAARAPRSAAATAASFTTVTSPNVAKSDYNELDGVAAVTPQDAWAVGFARTTGVLFHVLVEHWDGTAWSIRGSASLPAKDDTRLHALAVLSASNIWAVGQETTSTSTQSLIEHWNGARWAVVPSPAGEPAGSVLLAVAAVSPSDLWAVGHATGEGSGTLIEHWNGTAWSVVSSPSLSDTGTGYLTGVAALSAGNVWAVGRDQRHPVPVIEHWNGTSWSVVSQPVSGFDSALNSVSAITSGDIWAVGEQNLNQTVTEHWNGEKWALVPSPSVTAGNAQDTLSGVTAVSPGDVWAVGSSLTGGVTGHTLAEQWNGTQWQVVPATDPAAGSNQLNSVAGTTAGQPLWAVGFGTSSGTPQVSTLVETTTG